MIYGRGGIPVTIKRRAVLDDVRKLEGRRPDKQDREALEQGSYFVVDFGYGQEERLYHLAFLRADDGFREISAAIAAVEPVPPADGEVSR